MQQFVNMEFTIFYMFHRLLSLFSIFSELLFENFLLICSSSLILDFALLSAVLCLVIWSYLFFFFFIECWMLCMKNEAIFRCLPFADICKLKIENNLQWFLSTSGGGTTISNRNKVNLDLHLAPFTINILTWIIDLDIKAKTIKCLEET